MAALACAPKCGPPCCKSALNSAAHHRKKSSKIPPVPGVRHANPANAARRFISFSRNHRQPQNGRQQTQSARRGARANRPAIRQGLGDAAGRRPDCKGRAVLFQRLTGIGHRPGHRRPAARPGHRDLRAGIVRQDHDDLVGHRRSAEAGRHRRLHRRRTRAGPGIRGAPWRQHRRTAGLAAGHRRAGAGNHRHVGALGGGGCGGGRLGRRAHAQGRN